MLRFCPCMSLSRATSLVTYPHLLAGRLRTRCGTWSATFSTSSFSANQKIIRRKSTSGGLSCGSQAACLEVVFATLVSLYVPITCNLSSYLSISLGGQIADEMRHLESYFFDEFKRGRRMVKLYELVQVRERERESSLLTTSWSESTESSR